MLTCRQCHRRNPPDAAYCWYDGVHLGSPTQPAGPAAETPRRFPHPLVLRSGVPVNSFPDLARLAGAHWEELLAAVRDGTLERFLKQIGRGDLAQRAAWAAKHVDPDQALDELLDRLPGVRREPAQLDVAPGNVELGSISRTTPRTITLRLNNRGQALLLGTVRVEGAAWLSVGDAAGVRQKLFRCPRELEITVRVVGKALRAGSRPLEGKIVVDSNGGTVEIPVRALVPVLPFGEGVLAGARSPGELAEKARQSPREAAALFERGLVVAWYEANGWIYPVNGPIAEGLGAVQQFFEALGRAVPPRVTISDQRIELRGAPGESVQGKIVLSTTEQRTVYGHGVAHADWLEVGRPALDGPRATLPLRVRRVPDRPNEKLRTTVDVGSNGGQKFQVEVVLHVLPGVPGRKTAPETLEAPGWLFANVPETEQEPVKQPAAEEKKKPQPARVPVPASVPVPVPLPVPTADFEFPEPSPTPEPTPVPAFSRSPVPVPRPEPPEPAAEEPDEGDPGMSLLLLLLPLVLLGIGLGGLIVRDVWLPKPAIGQPGFPPDDLVVGPPDNKEYVRIDFNDRVRRGEGGIEGEIPVTMAFGLSLTDQFDPRNPNSPKLLTYDRYGRTNNTCVLLDGRPLLFGDDGEWATKSEPLPEPRQGLRSVWQAGRGVEVVQEVERIRGDAGKLDTCLVRYLVTNRDNRRHEVGIRFLLDTFIGANDGVPFTLPGSPDLCDTLRDFRNAGDVPDYIEALENENLQNPGTVAHLRLKLGNKVEAPSRVLLGAWPDPNLSRVNIDGALGPFTRWNVPVASMKLLHERRIRDRQDHPLQRDSAVTLYWDPKPLAKDETRVVGFTYGLGRVASGESKGKLLLTTGGRLVRGGEFTLTALVANPGNDETLTLELPSGLRRLEGDETRAVPPVPAGSARPISTLSWRLTADSAGTYPIRVRSSRGMVETTTVTIRTQGVFD